MFAWLRRSFVAGFFVTVPLIVSVIAFVWVFQFADRITSAFFGTPWPGLGIALVAAGVLAIGALTTNVLGRRFLSRGEHILEHIPLFRTVYAPVKQLISAFSPDNEFGFKRMVLVEDANRGAVLGFLTKEFTVDRGRGAETFLAVYVPTNHLYLGDVIVCPEDRASFPDLTVQEGVRIFLTGGTSMPEKMHVRRGDNVN